MYKLKTCLGMRNRSFPRLRGRFLVLATLLGTSVFAQQVVNTPPQLGTISGAVYRATNNEIVRGVLITLEAQDGTATNYRAFTDNDGHFTVKAVRAGKYVVTARKAGFAFQYYGEGSSPTVVSLKESEQLRDINIRLFEPGVISGHVTDEDGESRPALHAVETVRRKLVSLRRTRTTRWSPRG